MLLACDLVMGIRVVTQADSFWISFFMQRDFPCAQPRNRVAIYQEHLICG